MSPTILRRALLAILTALCALSADVARSGVETVRPLWRISETDPRTILPEGTTLLDHPVGIERFLAELDARPPDWARLYGGGEDAHMDRLFDENRARDRRRAGNPALTRRVAFVWEGIVTAYDPDTGGFRLAVGPKVIPTAWGDVRFKPQGLPGGLVALPPPELAARLHGKRERGETIEVNLILTGRLVPDESIIYDFAHEEAGRGMVMPVVRVERIDYFLSD